MAERIGRVLPTYPWLILYGQGYAYASPHREWPGYRWALGVTIYLA